MDTRFCEAGLRKIIDGIRGLREPRPEIIDGIADQMHLIAASAAEAGCAEIGKAAQKAEAAVRGLGEASEVDRWMGVEAVGRVGHWMLAELCSEAGKPTGPDATEQVLRRVLVVDDSRASNQALCHGFRTNDFAVRGASTLEEIFVELVLFKPHILISDVFMPDVEVEVVSRAFRDLSHGARSLLVLISGASGEELRGRLKEVKPDVFLPKKVGVSEVVARTIAEWNKLAPGAHTDTP